MVPFSLKNDIRYSQMQIEYSQFAWYNGTSVNWHSIVDEKAELESEIPVCKINFRFSISLARLNSGKLKLLYFSGS